MLNSGSGITKSDLVNDEKNEYAILTSSQLRLSLSLLFLPIGLYRLILQNLTFSFLARLYIALSSWIPQFIFVRQVTISTFAPLPMNSFIALREMPNAPFLPLKASCLFLSAKSIDTPISLNKPRYGSTFL